MGTRKTSRPEERVPYGRLTFRLRQFLIEFDSNFSVADESIMGSREVAKSMSDLTTFIDSVGYEQDSLQKQRFPAFRNLVYRNLQLSQPPKLQKNLKSSEKTPDYSLATTDTTQVDAIDFDQWLAALPLDKQIDYLRQAQSRVERESSDTDYQLVQERDSRARLRSHKIQLYKRYAVALSCILFFFIGAPLGAIIRKGGLGMPAVMSILLYLLYYTVDQFAVKMAKEGVWPIWEGVWMSSALLAVLGIFFTYQALNDSTMLNPEAWKIAFQQWLDKYKKQKN
jgi:lipopolysaccharide export system permease protein